MTSDFGLPFYQLVYIFCLFVFFCAVIPRKFYFSRPFPCYRDGSLTHSLSLSLSHTHTHSFHKKAPSQIFDWVLNTPLPCATIFDETLYEIQKKVFCKTRSKEKMHGHFLSIIKFLNIPKESLRRIELYLFLTFTLAIEK